MHVYQARSRFDFWKYCVLDSVIQNVTMLVLRQREKVAEKVLFSHVNCKHKSFFTGWDTRKAKSKSKFVTVYVIKYAWELS